MPITPPSDPPTRQLWQEFNKGAGKVDLVAFGSPHFSEGECAALADLMRPWVAPLPDVTATDLLGTSMGLRVPSGTSVGYARPGEVKLTSAVDASNTVTLARVGGWYSRDDLASLASGGQGSIAAADVDEWIDDHAMLVDRREGATVGRRDAVAYDLAPETAIIPFSVASEFFDPEHVTDASRELSRSRLWIVDIDDAPLVVVAGSSTGDVEWLDEFEQEYLPTFFSV